MGGGGAGGGFTHSNAGGSSGHINIIKIHVHDGENIEIIIGKGGKQATTVFPGENGEETTIQIDDGNIHSAKGGVAGGAINTNEFGKNFARGGNPSQNGHKIKQELIDKLNNC